MSVDSTLTQYRLERAESQLRVCRETRLLWEDACKRAEADRDRFRAALDYIAEYRPERGQGDPYQQIAYHSKVAARTALKQEQS